MLVASLVADVAAAPVKRERVAVVDGGPSDLFVEALRRELRSAGFQPVLVREHEPLRGSLQELAREWGVIAIVRTVPEGRGVEVWIESSVTGRPLLRQRVIDEGTRQPDAELVALQAVEVLRSGLAPAPEPAATRAKAPARVVPPAPIEAATPDWGLLLGPALALSPGGVGPAFGLKLVGYRRLSRLMALEASGFAPLNSSRIENARGEAPTRVFLSGVGARFWPAGTGGQLSPTLSAGAGLAWLRFDGQGKPPLVSTTEDALSLLLYGEASLAYRLSERLALRASLAPALAMTRVNIDFAGARAATWGPLVASGSLGLELAW